MVMVSKFNIYWYGQEIIQLDSAQVKESWGKNPQIMKFVNRAFGIYFKLARGINQVREGKLKKELRESLDEASTKGWELIGVGDMKSAIKHLADNNNQWTDNEVDAYRGNSDVAALFKSTIWPGVVVGAPQGVVRFMEEMDNKHGELIKILRTYDSKWAKCMTLADSAKDWKNIGSAFQKTSIITGVGGLLKDIYKSGQEAEPFLWLAPTEVERKYIKVSGYLGTLQKIYNFADDFGRFKSYGYSDADSAQFTALKTAMGYLPILGEFYAGALVLIPSLQNWFRGKIKEKQNKLDAVFDPQYGMEKTAMDLSTPGKITVKPRRTGPGMGGGYIPGPIGIA